MNRMWRWMLPCYLLTFPLTLTALVYALAVRAHSWRWQDGCLTFLSSRLVGNPGGQCWSPVIGFASEEQRARLDLQVHERTHVVQAFAVSLGALAVVPVPWFGLGAPGWMAPIAVSLIGSLGFALAYGAAFLWFYASEQPDEKPGWHDDYLKNPFEDHAYRKQREWLAASPSERLKAWGGR